MAITVNPSTLLSRTYTVTGASIPSYDFTYPPEVQLEREALYTETLALECTAGEHLLRLGGPLTDLSASAQSKMLEIWGDAERLRVPPAYQESSQARMNGAGTLTIDKPLETSEGELLLAFICASSTLGATITAPAGWTQVENATNGSTVAIRGTSFYKIAGASEPASYDFTIAAGVGSTVTGAAGHLHRISSANTSTPIEASATTSLLATANDTTPQGPTLTTGRSNCLVFHFLAHDHQTAANLNHDLDADSNETFVAIPALTTTGAVKLSTAAAYRFYGVPSGVATEDAEWACMTQAAGSDAIMHAVAIRP